MQFAQRMLRILRSPLLRIILLLHGTKITMKAGAYMALAVKQGKRVYDTTCAADYYLRENQNESTN